MKKTLALILAFAMVFSTISFVFADEEVVAISDEAAALGTLGVLVGDGGGVTVEYTAKELNRLTAAIMVLKLKGLYEEALEFDGVENFPDAENMAWAEGKNILAYLKANPEVGFAGDGSAFNPDAIFTEQMLYKVLLESLGYKQTTGEVVGDFAWDETIAFAEEIGLKPENAEKLTVDGLAKAVVGALKAENKDGKVWIDVLVEAGKIDAEKAVAAGFAEEAPVLVEVAVKEVKAIGNTVVQVEFKEAVGAEAENLDNYAVEGLEVKDAVVAGEKLVRLETAAQTTGKVYKMVIGEKTYQFAGVAKDAGAPEIDTVESKDVEEVVITFKNGKNIDFVSGTDVDNYSIAGVEVVKAEVDEDEVTLTTEGLKNKTDYTVKVTNIKSIDGATKKSDSKKFRTSFDLVAPKFGSPAIVTKTNQKLVVNFNEKVAQDTAEDVDNYEIVLEKTDDVLEIVDITWDDDDEDNVTIITEAMEKGKKYKLTINNIADQRKVANVMTRPLSSTFTGLPEDKDAPYPDKAEVQSPTTILITFRDKSSDIDEETVLDLNNYSSKNLDIEGIEVITNEQKTLKALLTVDEMKTGDSYELTIDNIADEFGNVMKSERTIKNIKAGADGYASADLSSSKIMGKNTIELVFTKELDKASAENIANYKVNAGIGAPKKAKLDDNLTLVTLTVNNLVQGYTYEIIVDGVEDLVGNELYFKDKNVNFDSVGGKAWDDVGPELEDASAVNKYVVALTFDERVNKTEAVGKAKLQLKKVVGDTATGAPFELTANDIIEDGTVVEFSDVAKTVYLEANVTYEIYKITGIEDYAGHGLELYEAGDFRFDGDDEDDGIVMEEYEQKNGITFKVTMERDVEIVAPTSSVPGNVYKNVTAKVYDGDDKKPNVNFKVTIDKDNDNVLLFAIIDTDVKIIEDYDYVFNFASFLTDKLGVSVAEEDEDEGETILTGEYTDKYAPEIEDVVAKNRKTVEVIFDEDINDEADYAGFFKLKNLDVEEKYSAVGIKSVSASGKKVTLTLAKPLEARYEYELTFIKTTPAKEIADLAGYKLKGDNDTFYFYGTNLAN